MANLKIADSLLNDYAGIVVYGAIGAFGVAILSGLAGEMGMAGFLCGLVLFVFAMSVFLIAWIRPAFYSTLTARAPVVNLLLLIWAVNSALGHPPEPRTAQAWFCFLAGIAFFSFGKYYLRRVNVRRALAAESLFLAAGSVLIGCSYVVSPAFAVIATLVLLIGQIVEARLRSAERNAVEQTLANAR